MERVVGRGGTSGGVIRCGIVLLAQLENTRVLGTEHGVVFEPIAIRVQQENTAHKVDRILALTALEDITKEVVVQAIARNARKEHIRLPVAMPHALPVLRQSTKTRRGQLNAKFVLRGFTRQLHRNPAAHLAYETSTKHALLPAVPVGRRR